MESDEPRFDLETSLYGPGSISCWFLTLLCVLITWTSHPTKNFRRLSVTVDVVLYALYACIAAGHMTALVRNLDTDEMVALQTFFQSGSVEKTLEGLTPALQKTLRGIESPFRVGVIFLWVALFSFICMVIMVGPGVQVRRRRRRPLPWLFCVATVWVSGCFVFLATHCGSRTVGYAALACTVKLALGWLIMIPTVYLGICYCGIATMPIIFSLFAVFGFVGGLSHLLGLRFKHLEGCLSRFSLGSGPWGLLTSPPCGVFAWLMYTTMLPNGRLVFGWFFESVIGFWYPQVDVHMSAFDQILALCSGIVAVLFTAYSASVSHHKIQLSAATVETSGLTDGHSRVY